MYDDVMRIAIVLLTLAGAVAAPQEPTFTVAVPSGAPVTIVAAGDSRFTDPSNTTATSPPARRALVARIATEKPAAVLISGDLPWHGGDPKDYEQYGTETAIWRTLGLRIFPALGNHEFSQCAAPRCLENWWDAFPDLRGMRWYSVRIGGTVEAFALDSLSSLESGSEERTWLEAQVAALPPAVRFVLIALHHPPVADVQTRVHVDHNPRANEIALADYLETAAAERPARFVVIAGHIHNYERFLQHGVTYLVSGGAGAAPYEVDRTPSDLYQDNAFPNFHYVKMVVEGDVLRGEMYRLADSAAASPQWDLKDRFEVLAGRP